MNKILKLAGIILLATIVTACAGRDFVRPENKALVLGETTYTEILSRFGKPFGNATEDLHGVEVNTISYAYSTAGNEAADGPGVTPARAISFSFVEEKLSKHDFVSSYSVDSTNFADGKRKQIVKGSTTRAEVESLLGTPQGKLAFPHIDSKENLGLIYTYARTMGSAFDLGTFTKTLIVEVDPKGIVQDYKYTQSGTN